MHGEDRGIKGLVTNSSWPVLWRRGKEDKHTVRESMFLKFASGFGLLVSPCHSKAGWGRKYDFITDRFYISNAHKVFPGSAGDRTTSHPYLSWEL
jgi:hypothetical protein